jgi:hypothetical protein
VDDDDDNDGEPDSVDCEPLNSRIIKYSSAIKARRLCLSRSAVEAHKKHGDLEGSCQSSVPLHHLLKKL